MSFLTLLSGFFGVGYVCFWSSSFYPVIIMNYKAKSSDALSLDSLLLNVIGYWSYFITIYLQLFNSKVIQEYKNVYKTKPILSMIDFFYASHCLICILGTVGQVLYYRILKLKSYRHAGTGGTASHQKIVLPGDLKYAITILRRVNNSTKYLMLLLTGFILVSLYKAFVSETLALLLLTKILTMVKLFVNCIKYVPQLVLNYKKKTVKGYPFLSVYFDMAGGTMSLCQIVLDNYLILVQFKHNRPINKMGIELDHSLHFSMFDFVKKNFAKCGLVLVGFFFDFCFLTQRRLYEREVEAGSANGTNLGNGNSDLPQYNKTSDEENVYSMQDLAGSVSAYPKENHSPNVAGPEDQVQQVDINVDASKLEKTHNPIVV